jgi:hypothetical protein
MSTFHRRSREGGRIAAKDVDFSGGRSCVRIRANLNGVYGETRKMSKPLPATWFFTVVCLLACAGLVFHAHACQKHNVPPTQKRGRQIQRFAIAGLVDINGDGESDLEEVRRLIQANRGRIDAELRMDGKLTGKLRPDTECIILGELPDKTALTPKAARQFDVFLRRAGELGIPVVPLKKLLGEESPSRSGPDAKSIFQLRRPSPHAY